ncbi:tRNA (uridine(54)-C5)-methyltransferase TrmA [Helicobacter sp. 11S02596-1]|uniref:tRNA (uridine(54)-C5)-methyltransferase TrmA n=1 Tax=Helicobacter sp. 11S02596-1 TaxID=1476194 RepID=UPI000BA52B1F|nr:tRNA (uridine(54)-C5)-methyltransferase TrmA [Helicobacter sp. 11S02596-1]PAF45145.1 tRNA (uridine(54)-C5)-methyltransferase TrmA [Helicobacter sp. 11S02596-1]
MICENFALCGGCQLDLGYASQLETKIEAFKKLFDRNDFEVFPSPSEHFRARAEFRIHREDGKLYLSMNPYGQNVRVKISSCPILLDGLEEKLLKCLQIASKEEILEHKLYGIKILGSLAKESLITLIYHKKLDEKWQQKALDLSQKLQCHIIGRSKKEKIILTQSHITEVLKIHNQDIFYIQDEGRFSQPNPYANTQMIEFVLSNLPLRPQGDLLEMYCGSGNFTIPLAKRFHKVFATEIVKSAITTLKENAKNNAIDNITPARLSGKETIEALNFARPFFRLKEINLKDFNFSHILLDPPRSGIGDAEMLEFIQRFEHIIYISCNPQSLKSDLATLLKTHQIKRCAVFDQFPYTHHLECGFILSKNT